MKTNKLTLLTFIGLVFFNFFLQSCSNEDDEITREFTSLEIVVDKVGSKSELGKAVQTNLKERYDLDYNKIERTTYSFLNNIEYFMIPFANNNSEFLAYYSDGINKAYTIVKKEKMDNKNNLFSVYNLNNLLIYKFTVNSEKGIMDFQNVNNLKLDVGTGGLTGSPADFNCGTLSFSDCIVCGIKLCSEDWRCALAAIAFGPEFAAGLAIVCGLEQIDNP